MPYTHLPLGCRAQVVFPSWLPQIFLNTYAVWFRLFQSCFWLVWTTIWSVNEEKTLVFPILYFSPKPLQTFLFHLRFSSEQSGLSASNHTIFFSLHSYTSNRRKNCIYSNCSYKLLFDFLSDEDLDTPIFNLYSATFIPLKTQPPRKFECPNAAQMCQLKNNKWQSIFFPDELDCLKYAKYISNKALRRALKYFFDVCDKQLLPICLILFPLAVGLGCVPDAFLNIVNSAALIKINHKSVSVFLLLRFVLSGLSRYVPKWCTTRRFPNSTWTTVNRKFFIYFIHL